VIDNLKTAILRAVQDDPHVQQSYRECAAHYGFLIAPCRVATPQHKGKVEQGGVHYVKRNFLGGREATTLAQANRDVLGWCNTTAGLRIHGTTKEQQPLARFQEVEQARLQTLPDTPYDMAVWKIAKLGRDCYVEFDKAYYSAPHRLITQDVCVCGGLQQMRIFTLDYKLIATHERAQKPGERKTHLDHLPPHKVPGLLLDRDTCLAAATDVGEATAQVGGTLLADPVLDRLPTVGQLLKLRGKFDDQRLEAACRRALYFDDPAYKDRQAHPVRRPGRASHPAPGNCAPGDRIRARAGGFAGHIPGRCDVELKHQLTPHLKHLRLSGVLETLDARQRQAIDGKWSYIEFLERLLEDEVERRDQKQLQLRLRRAALNTTKTLETFDFTFNPNINRQQVLALAACDYIR